MIDVTDFVNILNLQAMDIGGGRRVIDLKSIVYYALKYNMIDSYDLAESIQLLNKAIVNRCIDSEVKAKQIQGYAYGTKQYCAGKLYDSQEVDEYGNLQADNMQKVIDITDSMIYR